MSQLPAPGWISLSPGNATPSQTRLEPGAAPAPERHQTLGGQSSGQPSTGCAPRSSVPCTAPWHSSDLGQCPSLPSGTGTHIHTHRAQWCPGVPPHWYPQTANYSHQSRNPGSAHSPGHSPAPVPETHRAKDVALGQCWESGPCLHQSPQTVPFPGSAPLLITPQPSPPAGRAQGCWRLGQGKAENPCGAGGRAGAITAGSRARNKKYNRFIRLNLEAGSLPRQSAARASRTAWSSSRAGAGRREGWAEPWGTERLSPPRETLPGETLHRALVQHRSGGPALPARLGKVGDPQGGTGRGRKGLSCPGSSPVVSHTEWTVHYTPSQRAAQLLDGALSSLQSQLGLLAFSWR